MAKCENWSQNLKSSLQQQTNVLCNSFFRCSWTYCGSLWKLLCCRAFSGLLDFSFHIVWMTYSNLYGNAANMFVFIIFFIFQNIFYIFQIFFFFTWGFKIYDLELEENGCLVNVPPCLYRELQIKTLDQLDIIF